MAAAESQCVESCRSTIFQFASFQLKQKQIDAIKSVFLGQDTLCIFPTAFGKSLIYQTLPKLFKMKDIRENPVIVVLSPLLSLIEDQVANANSVEFLGLNACALSYEKYEDICSGKYNLIFGTPEAWINNSKWRNFLSSPLMVHNLVCIVVDEVHKVTW